MSTSTLPSRSATSTARMTLGTGGPAAPGAGHASSPARASPATIWLWFRIALLLEVQRLFLRKPEGGLGLLPRPVGAHRPLRHHDLSGPDGCHHATVLPDARALAHRVPDPG